MKRLRSRFSISTVVLIALIFISSIAKAQTPSIQFDSLISKIDSIAKKYHVPGAQVLVFSGDSILFKQNVGVKNLKAKDPVTDKTMFRLGSITKSFVAVSALQLIEKGEMKLEDKLKDLAPEIQFENQWEEKHPVRIVHLLEHTTGFDDWALKEYAFNSDTIMLDQGLKLYPESRKSRWRPGTFFAYCNSGPPIVARIIEKKTNQEYEGWVKRKIFEPLGLSSITFRRDGAALQHLVTNYSGQENPKEEPYWDILRRPAGSLNAPALELMPFVQMLMNRGTYHGNKLLDSASVDRMETPTASLAAEAGSKEGYGLHNYTTSFKGHVFHGHDGGVNGGLAHYVYNSDLNIGYIVLVNYDGEGFGKLNDAVMETIMKEVSSTVPSASLLSKGEIEECVGYYRSTYPRSQMTYFLEWPMGISHVYEQAGKLYVKPLLGGDENELIPTGGGKFIQLNKKGYTNAYTFTLNDEKEIVLIGGFGNNRKTTAFVAWTPIVIGGISLVVTLVGLVTGLLWIIRYFYLKSNNRILSALPARLSFWLYCLSFVSMSILIVTNFQGFTLGNPGMASYAVYVTSIWIALFAVSTLYYFVRDRKRIPSQLDKVFLFLCVASAFCVTAYLTIWGLIGIRTWL
jgi:CubicO group peptidase (beta-lactamase class C family)